MTIDLEMRKRRLRFRAWHRGTKEADYMIGGFVDSRLAVLSEVDINWLELLLEEQEVDIMGWVFGSKPCPPHFQGPLMLAMQKMDYIPEPGSYA